MLCAGTFYKRRHLYMFTFFAFLNLGSPKYFGPLLHFLRSGILEIPPEVSHTALHREAEFYGLKSVVAHFKQLEEEKRKREATKKSES